MILNFQGRVAVEGVNFDSTTAGHDGIFRFALVNGDGSETFWSNDATSVAGSEPAAGVTLPVVKGLYSVLLGDTAAPLSMAAIAPGVFTHSEVRLRVWFDDGVHGSQLLSPDQRIAAVGYAMVAQTIVDGAVTSSKLAAGAVGMEQLGAAAVHADHIAPGAVGNAQLADASLSISTGIGLAGGGILALGGTIVLENTGVTSLAGGGGVTVSASNGSITLGSNATPLGLPSTMVLRDNNGGFAAGTITAAAFAGSGAGLTGVPGTLPWVVIAGNAQQAVVNTGYLANAADAVTITLPAVAAVGDIVRVSGIGAGDWAIIPGSGQSVSGFDSGLGPVGSQGAGAAVQFVGNGTWQPMKETQLGPATVQASQLANGAVTSTKLAPAAVQAAHLAPASVGNSKLANSSITINTGAGLVGGGVLSLGDTITLGIPNGGIAAGQLAVNAVQMASIAEGAVTSAKLAQNAALANLNAGSVRQLAGTWDTTTFKGLNLQETGNGLLKPSLVLDRGIGPKGRLTYQKSSFGATWSGLVLGINANWHEDDGYAYDDLAHSQSILQMEYEYTSPIGLLNELNWTSAGRRIFFCYGGAVDSTKAAVLLMAPSKVLVPQNESSGEPAFVIEDYSGGTAPARTSLTIQNSNTVAGTSRGSVIRLLGAGSNGVDWYVGTDFALNGGNNFFVQDSKAVTSRFFIDGAGKVGINNSTPAAQLDVNGAVRIAGAIEAGGTVNATGYTVNGAPLQTVKHGLTYSGGQVRAMGQAMGTGWVWRTPMSLLNAFTPFGGGSAPNNASYEQGVFVPQIHTETARGCITLPRTWANGVQVRVRAWYCLHPTEMASTAPSNAVALFQGIAGRSTAPVSVAESFSAGWDLSDPSSGVATFPLAGGISGALLVDERTYTIPMNANLDSRLILFGRYGTDPGDTESKAIYFIGISVEEI